MNSFLAAERIKNNSSRFLKNNSTRKTKSLNCYEIINVTESEAENFKYTRVDLSYGQCYFVECTGGTLFTFGSNIEIEGYEDFQRQNFVGAVSNGLGGSRLYLLIGSNYNDNFYFWYDRNAYPEYSDYKIEALRITQHTFAILKTNWEGNILTYYDIKVPNYDPNREEDPSMYQIYTLWAEYIYIYNPNNANVEVEPDVAAEVKLNDDSYIITSSQTFTGSYINIYSTQDPTENEEANDNSIDIFADSQTDIKVNGVSSLPSNFPEKVILLKPKTLYSYSDPDMSDFFEHRDIPNGLSVEEITTLVITLVICVTFIGYLFTWHIILRKGCKNYSISST